ncbi:MAG: hypothetical protein COA42_06830 [Alteromonadaceae bacterium]|nr:MAG: hypothetical protein COA42_06830 [Alteromonadaceae bacterium]
MTDGLLRGFIIVILLVCAKPTFSMRIDGTYQHSYSSFDEGHDVVSAYMSDGSDRFGAQTNRGYGNPQGESILGDSLDQVFRFGNNTSRRNTKAYEHCQSRLCSVSSSADDAILLPVERYSVANLLTDRRWQIANIERSKSSYGSGRDSYLNGRSNHNNSRNSAHNGQQRGRDRVVINRGEHRRGVDSFIRRRGPQVAPVPVPASAVLFVSGLLVLVGFRKYQFKAKLKQLINK